MIITVICFGCNLEGGGKGEGEGVGEEGDWAPLENSKSETHIVKLSNIKVSDPMANFVDIP